MVAGPPERRRLPQEQEQRRRMNNPRRHIRSILFLILSLVAITRMQKTTTLSTKATKVTTMASSEFVNTQNGNHHPPRTTSSSSSGNVAFCLLIKDDNDILPEWIAYHYHTINLRRLIVAIDPSSKTTPTKILDRFRTELGLQFEEWTDDDYMPDFFVRRREYQHVPALVNPKLKDIRRFPWVGENDTQEQVDKDWTHINNYWFRQRTFIHKCARRLRHQNQTWMAHIDTDEYIVTNPLVRTRQGPMMTIVPPKATQSSLLTFLEVMFRDYPKRLSRACLSIPTILFGSYEDPTNEQGAEKNEVVVPPPLDPVKFETIRWRYHPFYNDIRNGYQKTIIDLSYLSPDDMLLRGPFAYNPHQPSNETCRRMTLYHDHEAVRLYPLTINHYIGSFERYSRREDKRRNRKVRTILEIALFAPFWLCIYIYICVYIYEDVVFPGGFCS